MLSDSEFTRLQKLACLRLSDADQERLGHHLDGIIGFLDQLQHIPLDADLSCGEGFVCETSLTPRVGVQSFDHQDALFANVHHQKVGRSILVSSVLDSSS